MALVYRSNRRSFDWFIIFSMEKLKEGVQTMKLDCVFCRRMALYSKYFRYYVCDDCYEKQEADKKEWIKSGEWKKYELE
jgi:uncharacterized protein YlaI